MSKKELMKAIKIKNNKIVIDNIDLSKMSITIKPDIGGRVAMGNVGRYVDILNVGGYVYIGDIGGYVNTGDIGGYVNTGKVGSCIDTSSCYQSPDKTILLPQITADGIRLPYTSKKTYKGITIYNLFKNQGPYATYYSHLITNGFVSAHGATLKQAKESFKKKIEIFKKVGK